jgi:hypothetical protein
MMPTSLEAVIAPTTPQHFASAVFGGPSIRLGPGSAACRFGIEDFEALLWAQEPLLTEHLAVFSSTDTLHPPRRRQHKDLFRWAVEQYRDGKTLRFADAHRVLPWVSQLAADCSRRLLSRVNADLVLLGDATSLAFGLAYKTDLLVVQTSGRTMWNLAPTVDHADGQERDVPLVQGESLYVCGDRARAVAAMGPAISLVLHVRPCTPADLLESLVEVVAEGDPQFRLTVPQDVDALQATWAQAVNRLRAEGASEGIVHRAWDRVRLRLADEHRPAPGGLMTAAESAARLTTESLVQIRPGGGFLCSDTEGGVYVYVPGLGGVSERESQPGGLIFPAESRELLNAILQRRGPFRASDLPAAYTLRARLATVRSLFADGALEHAILGLNR